MVHMFYEKIARKQEDTYHDFLVGDWVNHPDYGDGEIMEVGLDASADVGGNTYLVSFSDEHETEWVREGELSLVQDESLKRFNEKDLDMLFVAAIVALEQLMMEYPARYDQMMGMRSQLVDMRFGAAGVSFA